jgi:hypothetical protein
MRSIIDQTLKRVFISVFFFKTALALSSVLAALYKLLVDLELRYLRYRFFATICCIVHIIKLLADHCLKMNKSQLVESVITLQMCNLLEISPVSAFVEETSNVQNSFSLRLPNFMIFLNGLS